MSTVPERYNVSSLLDRNLEAGRGDKVAISCGDERVTYRELVQRVCRFGNALKALGFRRDERVVLVLNDSPAFPVAFFGTIRAGCVPVPANPLLKWEDQRYFLADSYARAVVVDKEHYEKVQRLHPSMPVHVYPAGHGFSCDERGSFHEPSARQARQRTIDFFREHVG